MAVRRKKAVEEPEEVYEELDDLEDLDDDDDEVEDLDDEDQDDEDLDDDDDDEEDEPAPRKRGTGKTAQSRQQDEELDIADILARGLKAYIDQEITRRENHGKSDTPERKTLARKAAPAKRQATRKGTQKSVKPARKTNRPATKAEVREWLQDNNYQVSDRGRISEASLRTFKKKTGRQVES